MRGYALVMLFCASFSFGQIPVLPGKIFKTPEKIKILGSPYNEKMFSQAKVGILDQKIYMRYNIYEDNFEFISAKNDTLVLDKTEDFGNIIFTNTTRKYKLITYTNGNNKLFYGYLLELYSKNEVILYRKDNITFTDEKLAKTTLEQNKPAKYAVSSPSYFIKFKEKSATEFPDSKKEIIKMVPDKKEAIDSFFKENKINFDDENDLSKIIDLLAGF
jgi:hypothetical protein